MKKRLFIAGTVLLCSIAILLWVGRNFLPISDVSEKDPSPKTAVLFSSFAQMWLQAGGEVDITVGESVSRGLVSQDVILVDSGAGKSIQTELLLASAPSLVIYSLDIPAQVEAAKLAEQSGAQIFGAHVENFEDYERVMERMMELTGDTSARTAITAQRQKIDALLYEKCGQGKTILFIRAGASASSTKAKRSEDHFACAMLTQLGCSNLADVSPTLCENLSMEEIIRQQPDAIFFSVMGNEAAARENIETMLSKDTFQALSAVQNGNTYILPKELFHFKPNDRWAESYEYLADILSGEK